MAGFNTVHSALRLSAIAIAAGTILGLVSSAAAQSRLERAERALERAQQELGTARRESGKSEQKGELQCEQACPEGCGSCEGQAGEQREVELTADDEDGDVFVQQPGQRRVERKIILRGDGEGHTCPLCGRPMDGAPGAGRMKGFDVGPHAQAFGFGGHEGGPFHVQTRAKVFVLDGNGERREFNIGGGDEGPEGSGQNKRIEIRRRGADGDEGGAGQSRKMFRIDGDGAHAGHDGDQNQRMEIRRFGGEEGAQPHQTIRLDGAGGAGHGMTGKIIIIGPDGQRREFDLGDMGRGMGGDNNQPARRRGPRVQIDEFRDGETSAAHPDQGGERRVIQVRKFAQPL